MFAEVDHQGAIPFRCSAPFRGAVSGVFVGGHRPRGRLLPVRWARIVPRSPWVVVWSCLFMVTVVKKRDRLRRPRSTCFGVHWHRPASSGGASAPANPGEFRALGGLPGIMDYTTARSAPTTTSRRKMIFRRPGGRLPPRWCGRGIGSAILYKVRHGHRRPCRANVRDRNVEGLDITEHTERAYNMLSSPRGATSQGRAQNYGSGHIPGNARPLRGSSASLEPLSFLQRKARSPDCDFQSKTRWTPDFEDVIRISSRRGAAMTQDHSSLRFHRGFRRRLPGPGIEEGWFETILVVATCHDLNVWTDRSVRSRRPRAKMA